MSSHQVDIFGGDKPQKDIRIEAAKEVLLKEGYRILDPIVVNDKIITLRQLRDYFYMRLDSKYPNRRKTALSNTTLDMTILSRFVKSQMYGASKFRAMQECVEIIDIIFDHEEEFNFKYPIVSIGILGQGKLAWVTARAVELLNKKRYEEMSKKINSQASEFENDTDIDEIEFEDKLNIMLKKVGIDNG